MTSAEIKNLVSVEQVLSSMYGFEVKKRMPCPIHNGIKNNFSVTRDFFKCFSCGVGGDIFSLVQALSNIDFMGARNLICDYFNLTQIYNKKVHKIQKVHLEHLQQEQETKLILKKLRRYQQVRICQVLRAIRTAEGNSYLEKHLEGLLNRFDERTEFFITHDIHAHLTSILNRYKMRK